MDRNWGAMLGCDAGVRGTGTGVRCWGAVLGYEEQELGGDAGVRCWGTRNRNWGAMLGYGGLYPRVYEGWELSAVQRGRASRSCWGSPYVLKSEGGA